MANMYFDSKFKENLEKWEFFDHILDTIADFAAEFYLIPLDKGAIRTHNRNLIDLRGAVMKPVVTSSVKSPAP